MNELDRQIGSLRAELDTVTLDLLLAEDALAETRAILDKRLVEIYKRGSLWIFEVLLAAESFGDLLSRYKYLYLVSRQDRALTRSVEELRHKARFVKISAAGMRESHVHDVIITKEAPNYRVEN